MKTLITGADGFLGNNVVRELIKRSYPVRVFLQPGSRQKSLERLDLDYVYGDLLDPDSIKNAVRGCEAIIHCAALTTVWPAHHTACGRVNVLGTRHLVRAAQEAGIDRMVHVSSASAFAPGTLEQPGDERMSVNPNHVELDYIRSKILGQQVVLDAVQRAGLPAVIVNPTFMIGPFDAKPSSGKLILTYVNGKLPGYTLGGRNFISVKDVAFAICNALTLGDPGECYILGNENLTYKAFFDKISMLTGIPRLHRQIGTPFIRAFGIAGSLMGAITRKQPTLSYSMSKQATIEQFYSSKKARLCLGLPETPIEYAITDGIKWFVKQSLLDLPVDRKKFAFSLADNTNSRFAINDGILMDV